mmetsp:Transcript_4369/g.9829  ORF Transcript_4369/g.9829 Transcript_4369/m.9829 type:complete len:333 (-) Transcript_4369:77-1075(-)
MSAVKDKTMFEELVRILGERLRFRRRKKEPPPRRPVIKTAHDALNSDEAAERVRGAVALHLPGGVMRWQKILQVVNFNVEPTEEDSDPLRMELELSELRMVLRDFYEKKTSIASEGLALAREFVPMLYDKHSVERGLQVSQRERQEKGLTDECLAYGELDHEIFSAMFLRVVAVYGQHQQGVFYDLGCGVGKLVYTAAFIGSFERVNGVEVIACLLERGEKRTNRWEKYQPSFPERIRETRFDWIEDDFVISGFYTDASCILLHWTALSNEQQRAVARNLGSCAEGTYVLSFTKPVPGDDFEVLVQDTCVTSWGKADWFFQEKLTPARARTT